MKRTMIALPLWASTSRPFLALTPSCCVCPADRSSSHLSLQAFLHPALHMAATSTAAAPAEQIAALALDGPASQAVASSGSAARPSGFVYCWGRGEFCLGVAPTAMDPSNICPFAEKVLGPATATGGSTAKAGAGKASSSSAPAPRAASARGSGPTSSAPLRCVQVACGESMTAAVDVDGALWSWGSGSGGRLGHGSVENQPRPFRVGGLLLAQRVFQVSAGEAHAGCVVEAGLAFVWGKGGKGALGDGLGDAHQQLEPKLVCRKPRAAAPAGEPVPLQNLHFIDCSYQNTAVISREGECFVWGASDMGKLGLGAVTPTLWPTRLTLSGGESAAAASSSAASSSSSSAVASLPLHSLCLGSSFSGFVTRSGQLWMCGYGKAGNLGQGNRVSTLRPVLVSALAGHHVVSVSCTRGQITVVSGGDVEGCEQPHTLAVTADGRCFSFGTAHKGMLGNLKNKALSPKGCDELLPYEIGGLCKDAQGERSGYLVGMHVRGAIASHIHSAVLGTWSSETSSGASSSSSSAGPPDSEAPRTCEVLSFGCGSDGRMGVRRYMEGLSGGRSRLKCYISQPSPVVGLQGRHVLQIDSARRHMVALVDDGGSSKKVEA